MQFYRIQVQGADGEETREIHVDQHEAHQAAKRWLASAPRLELFEVPTDKLALRALLVCAYGTGNAGGENSGVGGHKVLRTWALTPRGGLREVENGE